MAVWEDLAEVWISPNSQQAKKNPFNLKDRHTCYYLKNLRERETNRIRGRQWNAERKQHKKDHFQTQINQLTEFFDQLGLKINRTMSTWSNPDVFYTLDGKEVTLCISPHYKLSITQSYPINKDSTSRKSRLRQALFHFHLSIGSVTAIYPQNLPHEGRKEQLDLDFSDSRYGSSFVRNAFVLLEWEELNCKKKKNKGEEDATNLRRRSLNEAEGEMWLKLLGEEQRMERRMLGRKRSGRRGGVDENE